MNGEGCCECGGARHFPTRQEKIAALKEYEKTLKLELEGVSEKIKDLEGKGA